MDARESVSLTKSGRVKNRSHISRFFANARTVRISANDETRYFRMIFHTGSRNDRPSFESPRERRVKDTRTIPSAMKGNTR